MRQFRHYYLEICFQSLLYLSDWNWGVSEGDFCVVCHEKLYNIIISSHRNIQST